MMALAREWLLGITGAAILAALADGLMPEGAVKRVGRLVCGMILLAAILRPVATVELPDPSRAARDYFTGVGDQTRQLKEEADGRMKSIIEERAAAYVMDKAAEVGIVCRVRVECALGEESVFFPQSAQVVGTLSDAERSKLAQWLQTDLGIPPERQAYIKEESP